MRVGEQWRRGAQTRGRVAAEKVGDDMWLMCVAEMWLMCGAEMWLMCGAEMMTVVVVLVKMLIRIMIILMMMIMDPNCSKLDLSIKTTVNILDLNVKVVNQLSISPLSSNASSAQIVLASPEGLRNLLVSSLHHVSS